MPTCSAISSRGPTALSDSDPPARQGRLTALVGAGILVARVLGFVRERVFAHFFGDGPAADAFRAALRIPNVIRNLLGEGTLSASFIPVYAGLIQRGAHDDARRLSGIIASLLVLLTAAAAVVGIVLAPVITDVVAPGFSGDTRDLTVRLVEIMFPMSGVLILSAWCLGVLNTHRRFFLSYAAPALWNIVQIATLVVFGGMLLEARLAVALAWGALLGSVVQLVAQLPTALNLAGRLRWSLALEAPGVRRVIRAWMPVVVGAGAYQISSIVDTQLASFLPQGAVAILGYAQLVALLPVSLFGVSVAAVALPELSRDAAGQRSDEDSDAVAARREVLRGRVADAVRRLLFFALPSAVAFATLAVPLIGALFQTGAFGAAQTAIAASVLSAYALAIPAQASVKLLASGHYALGDTRTPVAIAVLSVAISAGSAYVLMQRFGPAGIALGAAAGAYVNSGINYARLSGRIGAILAGSGIRHAAAVIVATLPAAGVAHITAAMLESTGLLVQASGGLLAFGLVYGVVTLVLRHPEAMEMWRKLNSKAM